MVPYQVLPLQAKVDLRAIAIKGYSSIAGLSTSASLVLYPRHTLREISYPSAKKQSIYSIAPADLANHIFGSSIKTVYFNTKNKEVYFFLFSGTGL